MAEKDKATESLTKRQIISEVSKHTNIRKDAVELILDGFTDIAVEEIVNKGEFRYNDLFTITSKDWNKSYTINGGNEVGQQSRLIIKLSAKIRELWKLRFNHFDGSSKVINRNNWRVVFKNFSGKRKPSSKAVDNNPLLDNGEFDVADTVDKSLDNSVIETTLLPDNPHDNDDFNPLIDDEE